MGLQRALAADPVGAATSARSRTPRLGSLLSQGGCGRELPRFRRAAWPTRLLKRSGSAAPSRFGHRGEPFGHRARPDGAALPRRGRARAWRSRARPRSGASTSRWAWDTPARRALDQLGPATSKLRIADERGCATLELGLVAEEQPLWPCSMTERFPAMSEARTARPSQSASSTELACRPPKSKQFTTTSAWDRSEPIWACGTAPMWRAHGIAARRAAAIGYTRVEHRPSVEQPDFRKRPHQATERREGKLRVLGPRECRRGARTGPVPKAAASARRESNARSGEGRRTVARPPDAPKSRQR